MDSALVCLVLLTSGMNFGWQPVTGDPAGYEYVVQVEPELLDKLNRGESVPIESNVPSEVTPIRKVRIVVGSGELPRVALGADAKKLEKYVAKDARAAAPAAIVRGQSPDETAGSKAVPRTANFAGDNGWAAGSANYDRYNQPPGTAGGVSPPPAPSFLERSQSALSESGTSLKQGIDAGFQSASQQFQGVSSSASQQLQQASNSVGISSSGVSAPPSWPTSAAAPAEASRNAAIVQTATGWTSIGGNLAAPPLMTPLSSSSTATTRTAALGAPPAGPSFPPPATTSATGGDSIRSVLVDPSRSTAGNNTPWTTGPGTNAGSGQPGISRSGDMFASGNDSGLTQVQPIPGTRTTPQQSTQRYGNDPWPQDERFGAAPQSLPAAQTAGFGTQPAPPNNTNWQMPQAPAVTNNTVNPAAGSAQTNILSQRQPGPNPSNTQTQPAEQQPWMPLLLASLTLIGSLSANLFLGWSYLDARQRYSSLVYRTASAFRRTTGDAAA